MKTIFFNWDKIIRAAKHDPYKVLSIFGDFSNSSVPTKLAGNSYLLNISDFVNSKDLDTYKFDYILLAAMRNYFDYEYQDDSRLWLPFSTSIDTVKIQKNRLLQIHDNYIRFKYEE
jgi:hypothetical protein